VLTEGVFVEMVIWQVPQPVRGSSHSFKYRLALIADGVCVEFPKRLSDYGRRLEHAITIPKRADPDRDAVIVAMAIDGYSHRDIAAAVDMTRVGVKHAVTIRLADAIVAQRGFVPRVILSYCYLCQQDKPATYFHRDRSRPNGYSPRCRACQREYDLSRPNFRERMKRLEEHMVERAGTTYWHGRPTARRQD
jgi:hypothetical protein